MRGEEGWGGGDESGEKGMRGEEWSGEEGEMIERRGVEWSGGRRGENNRLH